MNIKLIRPLIVLFFLVMFATLYNQTYNEKTFTFKNIVALPVNYSPLEFGCKAHRSGATCFIMEVLIFNDLPALEVWKTITGFEGYYEISNYGRIKSLPRYIVTTKGFKTTRGGFIKILTLGTHGYFVVNLRDKVFLVHRLVGEAFISNPDNKRTINHKNGITIDNYIDNLEWATDSENHIHAYKVLQRIPAQRGKINTANSKTIYQIDINTNDLINKFTSGNDAARAFNLGHTFSAGISRCATKLTESYHAYKWRFNYDKQV